jgi:hypothetical protein
MRGFVQHPATRNFPTVDAGHDDLRHQTPHMPIQNLLIWLFDGVSTSYFKYNLPKTWAFLETLLEDKSGKGGFLLRGHNVVGINTRPNLIAMCTGWKNLKLYLVIRIYTVPTIDNRRFWLSAHNCQVSTPTSQNLELEHQIRIFGAD